MAAPLKTVLKKNAGVRKQNFLLNSVRCYYGKFWERGDDSIYETGESRWDRYVNVPIHKKPHPETPKKGQYELVPEKGKVYSGKPFPVKLQAGKRYKWCSCGYSHSQPLCDGSHKFIARYLGSNHTRYYPVTFEVEKNGTYWMCNCKQTGNRPFCDGTHRSDDIQKKYKK